MSELPIVSVVLEGYNQSRELGHASDTIAALAEQTYPLDRVEVILVGSREQAADWSEEFRGQNRFASVKAIGCDRATYFVMKNEGAAAATGDIIAFTDSDVRPRPGWLRSIVDGIAAGADVVTGPSLFRAQGGPGPDTVLMRAAAAVTWGWVMGKRRNGIPEARGFPDHNVAMRAEVAREHLYRTDLGRILASPILFRRLVRAGKKVMVCRDQQAAHQFTWRYWLIGLEFRYGHEVYRLRRLDDGYPNLWIRRAGIFEPIVTFGWHLLLDVPKWFRFSELLGTSVFYRAAVFPLFFALSVVARTSEMAGMYATMIAPERARKWAENV